MGRVSFNNFNYYKLCTCAISHLRMLVVTILYGVSKTHSESPDVSALV
jgi:hypothetical protein